MFRLLIFPIALVVSIVSVIWLVVPNYKEAKRIQREDIPKVQKELDKEFKITSTIKSLKEDYKENQYDLRTLNYAIPNNKDAESLLVQIEAMVINNDLIYEKVDLGDKTEEQGMAQQFTAGGLTQVQQKTLPTPEKLNIELSVKGTYDEIKGLLKDLETLNRLVNVVSIKVASGSGGEEESSDLEAELVLEAYKQEAIKEEDVRGIFTQATMQSGEAGIDPVLPGEEAPPPVE